MGYRFIEGLEGVLERCVMPFVTDQSRICTIYRDLSVRFLERFAMTQVSKYGMGMCLGDLGVASGIALCIGSFRGRGMLFPLSTIKCRELWRTSPHLS